MIKKALIIKITAIGLIFILTACQKNKIRTHSFVKEKVDSSIEQIDLLIENAIRYNKIPRSIEQNGEYKFCREGFDWTEGFFPGILWNIYSIRPNQKYKEAAIYFQSEFEAHKRLESNHDLGFVFNNSYGLAYQITKDSQYKEVLIEAGNSLIQRFDSTVGCIQSWDVDQGWQSNRGWEFPVIIDNLMNLELLFHLEEITGNSIYKEIAIAHANTTLKNHFREDNSSYHVVDYDTITGHVRRKETAQGYAHESAWARGQAWGLYGFTMCYRFTKDLKYLAQAEKIAEFIINHPNLPEDKIPYWDFNAPKIPNEPRDASAAAIIASALLELDEYSTVNYLSIASDILKSLSSEAYFAELGTNKNFILMHSVGSIPHGAEIDAPIIYADYYYLEALIRLDK